MNMLTTATRPRLRFYLLLLTVLVIFWVSYVLFGSYQYRQSTGLEVPNMGSTIRNGALIIVGVLAVVFAGHWMWRGSQAPGLSATLPAAVAAEAPGPVTSNPEKARVLAGTGQQYALEIRAVGLAVTGRHQDTVWKQIETKADNYSSILSLEPDPKEYGKNPDERRIFSKVDTGAAFRYAAGEAVDHWPVPVIILGPPKGKDIPYRAAFEISDARQNAGLGVTEFLWLDDQNASSAAPALTKLFDFFDKHPDVPAALIVSQDGMQYRWGLHTPGVPKDPLGAFIPPVPDSMGGLLVARTDRIDHFVRPYAVPVPGDIDKTKTQYDVIKLWNFYWAEDDKFQEETDKAAGETFGATTMKTDWWVSKLPELWKQIDNKGPGNFKPSPFLPVRWANWQVDEFDEAPLLGYLHRPVEIKLTDSHGKQLKRAEQVTALQSGWKEAMATLPTGTKPTRVFYDTTLTREWTIPLTQALHGNAEGLDISEVKEGYDIGRRIGNTGVSSALVQVCLATIANYQEGGASATVNLMDNGTASIVMVSPPDEASKANNAKHRGDDPFKYRSN
ncbi:type VI lipase adapter Tla3 domain-containing protein [Paraburkholderia megapolitana]|uniref:type VI lipase adapter Tla3 domain-containing protein n=1 Tax=Paraburkholderia megapolitana TaxID=420953 RepID=UPI0038BCDC9B